MQRIRVIMGLAVLLGLGTVSAWGGQFMSQYWNKSAVPPDGIHWGPQYPVQVPTVQGAWGEPIEMAAPYNIKPPTGADAARAMIAASQPLDLVQQSGYFKDSGYPILPTGGPCPGGCPGGVCPIPGAAAPPANLISPPGIAAVPPAGMPPAGMPPAAMRPPGAVAAVGALTGAPAAPFPVQRTEVRFVGPAGMKISWYGPCNDGKSGFGPQYLQAPARYNFLQASIYRLKLTNIPNRPGMAYYPTLEVVPANPKTNTFLAHSAVPITFTEEDFEQLAAGNFVVKVIYLPDAQYQDLAATGPDEVVSSRLEPGVDPIIEAKRRGSILLVVRLGNIDLEAPNTPSMDAPNPFAPLPPALPPGVTPPRLPPPPGAPVPAGMPTVPGGPTAGQPYAPNMPNPMAGSLIPNIPNPMAGQSLIPTLPNPMAGQSLIPNIPDQMAPNLPPRSPMAPYGMFGSQPPPPAPPYGMQPNPAMASPGQMLPPAPGVPGAYPTGTQVPGQPGTPTGQIKPPNSVQTVQYPQRLPTLAELAVQPANANTSSGSR